MGLLVELRKIGQVTPSRSSELLSGYSLCSPLCGPLRERGRGVAPPVQEPLPNFPRLLYLPLILGYFRTREGSLVDGPEAQLVAKSPFSVADTTPLFEEMGMQVVGG